MQQKASSLDHLVGAGEHALAAELGKDGVRVNAIGPGLIETPLNEKVRASNPELVKTFIDHTPLGRTGKPEDIVGPAIFLASESWDQAELDNRDALARKRERSSLPRLAAALAIGFGFGDTVCPIGPTAIGTVGTLQYKRYQIVRT